MQATEKLIDLAKLTEQQAFPYVVQLMAALNDLSSAAYLVSLIDRDRDKTDFPPEVQASGVSYLVRVQVSQLYEACTSLINAVRPTKANPEGPHPEIYAFIKADAQSLEAFNKVVRLASGNRFQKLNKVRNLIAFHYGELAEHVPDALTGLMKVREFNEEPAYGQIFNYPDLHFKKFSFADEVVGIVWRNLERINYTKDFSNSVLTNELKSYITELGSSFVAFADFFITRWIYDHHLEVNESMEQ